MAQTAAYRIRLDGHLGEALSDAFEGASVHDAPHGVTELSVDLPDQAALHGLLARIRDLGLPLLSVEVIEQRPTVPGHKRVGVERDVQS